MELKRIVHEEIFWIIHLFIFNCLLKNKCCVSHDPPPPPLTDGPAVLSSNYKDALLDRESEVSSMLEKLRLKEAEIQRMREDEAHRAGLLHNAILAYVHSSSPAHHSSSAK